jgi:hypothetical protein
MQPTQQQEPIAMELEPQTHLKQEQQELNESLCDELHQPHQNHCEELHQPQHQHLQDQHNNNHQQQQRKLRSRSKQRRQQCEERQPKKLRAHKMFPPCEHEMVVWEHLLQAKEEHNQSIEAHRGRYPWFLGLLA